MIFFLMNVALAMAADPEKIEVKPSVDLWLAGAQTSAFTANAAGVKGGQGAHVDGRHLVGFSVQNEAIGLNAGVGLTQNQLWGDPWSIAESIDERQRSDASSHLVQLRRLSVKAQLPVAQIETGLVTSHWGLGMLANDGAHDPYFGLPEFGDRVIRARITTKPTKNGPWFLSGAVDRVLQDDQTIDPRRQWTQQGILSLLWRDDDDSWGVYGVSRRQDELDVGRMTRVGVLDAFVDMTAPVSENSHIRLAAEAAGVSGKTNRSTSYGSPERLLIRSGGATGLTMFHSGGLGFGSAFGYASGDGDPTDNQMNDFTFDRNFDVGMILFDEVTGGIEAATYLDLTNPEYAGSPPSGVEASVTEGSFRRASYLQPRIQLEPLSWIEIRGGMVFAWSTAPFNQPFYTVRNGGVPVNQLKQETDGYSLGTEIDWSVRITPFGESLREKIGHAVSVSMQGGHAQLSENLGGENVQRYILMMRVH